MAVGVFAFRVREPTCKNLKGAPGDKRIVAAHQGIKPHPPDHEGPKSSLVNTAYARVGGRQRAKGSAVAGASAWMRRRLAMAVSRSRHMTVGPTPVWIRLQSSPRVTSPVPCSRSSIPQRLRAATAKAAAENGALSR